MDYIRQISIEEIKELDRLAIDLDRMSRSLTRMIHRLDPGHRYSNDVMELSQPTGDGCGLREALEDILHVAHQDFCKARAKRRETLRYIIEVARATLSQPPGDGLRETPPPKLIVSE